MNGWARVVQSLTQSANKTKTRSHIMSEATPAAATPATAAGGLESINALFDTEAQFAFIPLEMITIKEQVREIFETADSSLEEMAASIKAQGVLQPILLREMGEGYELIAGERRYRASKMAGLAQIPALIRAMTDEQAEDAQLAENIQRLNLSQMETAKKIQKDLDSLGSVQAVLAKHNKSESWLSKMLSLLNLPEETKRLITENVSADLEVIQQVRQVEKVDKAAAKKLVDDLKKTRGKQSARKQVAAVKDKVKPSKAKAKAKQQAEKPAAPKTPSPLDDQATLPINKQAEDLMAKIYQDIVAGKLAGKIVSSLRPADKLAADEYLRSFYKLGQREQDAGRSVIDGFRQGIFELGTFRELHISAYMYGLDGAEFILLNVITSIQV